MTRYSVGDLSLHSFTNSTSTEAKRDNWSLIQKFVTTQEAPGDDSSPPTPQPPAGAMLNSSDFSKNTITPSEQARLEAVNSQYTMDNLQHLMQQQLAFFAPERQQGIIASVIEQRSIFVQKLMQGETPQDAMSAALAKARTQLPEVDAAQLRQQVIQGQPVENRAPVQHAAPMMSDMHSHMPQQQRTPAHSSGQHGHRRQAQSVASAPKQSLPPPFSVPEVREMAHPASHRLRSTTRKTGTGPSERQTMKAWRNDVNNPKTEGYRYWDLGKLGPEASEELMAKKMAAQKAKEYGVRVGELVKANCKVRQPPKKEMSNRERAKEFAKTVPVPSKRMEPKVAQIPEQSIDPVEDSSSVRSVPTVQRKDSVSNLLTKHDANARSIADIKDEVRKWELEDQEADVPLGPLTHSRRRLPAKKTQKQPYAQMGESDQKQTPHPANSQPQEVNSPAAPAVEPIEAASETPEEGDMAMPHQSAVEVA